MLRAAVAFGLLIAAVAPPAGKKPTAATGNDFIDTILSTLGSNEDASRAEGKDAFLALEATVATDSTTGQILGAADGIEWYEGRADITVLYMQQQQSDSAPSLGQLQIPEFTSRLESLSSSSLYYSDLEAPSADLPCALVALNGSEADAHYGKLSMAWAPVRGLLLQPRFLSSLSTSSHGFVFPDTTKPVLVLAPELAPRCNLATAGKKGKSSLAPGTTKKKRSGRPSGPEDATTGAGATETGECIVTGLGAGAKFDDVFTAKRAVMKDLDASISESIHRELGLVGGTAAAAEDATPRLLSGDDDEGNDNDNKREDKRMASPASLRRALAMGSTHSTTSDFLPVVDEQRDSQDQGGGSRLLYIRPSSSKGTRSILAVKVKFSGQPDTALSSDSDLRTLMDNAVSELQRSSYGFATFTYSLPAQIITLSSSIPVCTSNYDSIATDARAQAQSVLGQNPSAFRHFFMLLPNCQQQWGWSGLGSCPGGTVWLNAAASAYSRTAIHEMGHNLGLLHASFLDPITGAWTEYLDPFEVMSSGGNDFTARDFNAGYKIDLGYIPENRIVTFGVAGYLGDASGTGVRAVGSIAAADNAAPYTLNLVSEDTGDLSRGGGVGNPLGIRFRHRNSVLGFSGNRYVYGTYRSRSPLALNGLVFNDVPHLSWTAGNARIIDTTIFTDSQNDADVEVGSAWTVDSADGRYLIENRKLNSASDPRDNTLSLRVGKLSPATGAPPYGLGCYGSTCQQSPLAPIAVTLSCVSNPSTTVTVTIPVGESGHPRLLAVAVPDLANRASTSPQQGVVARLCNTNGAGIQLAAYTDIPYAELLTSSSLSRGNAPYPSSPGFVAGSGWASGCKTANLFVTSDGPRYVAASATVGGSSSAGDTASLTFSCAPTTGAAASAYGPSYSVGSQTSASVVFSNNYFSGIYKVDATTPYVNGALQWVSASFRIVYSGGVWSLQPMSGGGYYAQQQDTSGTRDLSRLTAFGSMSFSFTFQCPAHSFAYVGSGGCTPCPLYAQSRGGGRLAAGNNDVSSVCFCQPGYFMSAGSDGRYLCQPCAAGTYKERPGNSGTDSTAGCIPCPAPGYGSYSGSSSCAPLQQPPPSTGTLPGAASLCRSYLFTGYRSDVNGVYGLDTTVTVATTTANNRDSWGEGKAVFASSTTPGRYMIADGTTGTVYFGSDPQLGSWSASVKSFRAPQLWTSTEWTATYATTARASCVCDPYGATSTYGGCVCPTGQSIDPATARCKDASTTGCSRNNGGCSDVCSNTANGPVCSCSRPGFGLDAATRSVCSLCPDNQYVGSGGVCVGCPANSPGRTSSGTACGCPFGYVLTSATGACVPPSDITVDVQSTAVGDTDKTWPLAAAPFRGRYSACRAPSTVPTGVLAWQLVQPATGTGGTAGVPVYLVYHPAASTASNVNNGSWSIASGSIPATPAGAPRYAFADGYRLTASGGWPTSVAAGGATMVTATGAMVPSGSQSFFVFSPHPNGFTQGQLTFSVANTGAPASSSLPACGSSFDLVAADSTAKLGGTSTLGGGTSIGGGGTVVVEPSTTPTAAPSVTATRTASGTAASTVSGTASASGTSSRTPSPSASLSAGASPSGTPSNLPTRSASPAGTPSQTASGTGSPSPSAAVTSSASAGPSSPAVAASPSLKPTSIAVRASVQFEANVAVQPRALSSPSINIKGIAASLCSIAANTLGDRARASGKVSSEVAAGCVRSRAVGKWPLGYDPMFSPDPAAAAPPVLVKERNSGVKFRFLQTTGSALPPGECDLGFFVSETTFDPATACQLTGFDVVLALNDTVVVTDPAMVSELSNLGVGSTVNQPLPPSIVQGQMSVVNDLVATPGPLLQAMATTPINLDPASNDYSKQVMATSSITADPTSVSVTGGAVTDPVGVGAPVVSPPPPGGGGSAGGGGGGTTGGGGLSKSTIIAIVVGGFAALMALVIIITLAVVYGGKRKNKERVAREPRTRRLSVPIPPITPAAASSSAAAGGTGIPPPLSSAPAAMPEGGAHARTPSNLLREASPTNDVGPSSTSSAPAASDAGHGRRVSASAVPL